MRSVVCINVLVLVCGVDVVVKTNVWDIFRNVTTVIWHGKKDCCREADGMITALDDGTTYKDCFEELRMEWN